MSTQTCQQTRREISDLIDGETSALPKNANTHLSDCGDCIQFFDDARALDGKLSLSVSVPELTPSEVPNGFHARVLAAARESDSESKVVMFPRWLIPAAGAAAAAIIALVVLPKAGDDEIAGTVEPVQAPVEEPPGLPSGFETPIDVPAMTAVAGRGMEMAFGREAEAIASDIEKIRGFFTSRVTVVGRIGL